MRYGLVINTDKLRKKLSYISAWGWLTNIGQDNFWPHIKFLDTVSYEEMPLNVISEMCILSPWLNSHKLNMPGGLLKSPIIGGSRGGREGRTPPPWASKFFRFHAVFGKIWRVHAPPGGFTPPPSGKSWIRHCQWIPVLKNQEICSQLDGQDETGWFTFLNDLSLQHKKRNKSVHQFNTVCELAIAFWFRERKDESQWICAWVMYIYLPPSCFIFVFVFEVN